MFHELDAVQFQEASRGKTMDANQFELAVKAGIPDAKVEINFEGAVMHVTAAFGAKSFSEANKRLLSALALADLDHKIVVLTFDWYCSDLEWSLDKVKKAVIRRVCRILCKRPINSRRKPACP